MAKSRRRTRVRISQSDAGRYRSLRFRLGSEGDSGTCRGSGIVHGFVRTDPYANAPRLPADEPVVDPRDLVGGGRSPVELEIGPGRGGFLFERLAAADVRMVGLEIRRKWATIVDARLRERGYGQRARVFAEDARAALPRFADACASAVYVNFPDPWWKRCHQKRLVIAKDLANCLARILIPRGELFVQTDVLERAEAYHGLLSDAESLEPVGHSPWVQENPYGAQSSRERRALADGLPIYRLRFRRKLR
jgi:tRNA (guanine-N7-)-methyltransferase